MRVCCVSMFACACVYVYVYVYVLCVLCMCYVYYVLCVLCVLCIMCICCVRSLALLTHCSCCLYNLFCICIFYECASISHILLYPYLVWTLWPHLQVARPLKHSYLLAMLTQVILTLIPTPIDGLFTTTIIQHPIPHRF
jgi:hypothetical protein